MIIIQSINNVNNKNRNIHFSSITEISTDKRNAISDVNKITRKLNNELHQLNKYLDNNLHINKSTKNSNVSSNTSKNNSIRSESTFVSLNQSLQNKLSSSQSASVELSNNISHSASTSNVSINNIKSSSINRNNSKNILQNSVTNRANHSNNIKSESFTNILKNKSISFLHKIKKLYRDHKKYDPKKYKYLYCANCGFCCKSSDKVCPHCGYQLHYEK